MTQRLPTPGGDNGDWGDILNAFLEVSLNSDGTIANNTVGTNQLQNNSVTNTQLDSSIQSAIANANSALSEATADSRYVQQASLGVASGIAQLDSNGDLVTSQLPSSVESGSSGRPDFWVDAFGATGNGATDDTDLQ